MAKKSIENMKEEIKICYQKLKLSKGLIAHLQQVTEISTRLCLAIQKNGYKLSESDVFVGAALHDIGYMRVNGIRHGIAGAEIALELGYSRRIAKIIENHILGGISKELIISANLDLPIRNFSPTTIEEKIVACADLLVHQRSKSGIYLIEDSSRNEEIAMNMCKLFEEILWTYLIPQRKTVRNSS